MWVWACKANPVRAGKGAVGVAVEGVEVINQMAMRLPRLRRTNPGTVIGLKRLQLAKRKLPGQGHRMAKIMSFFASYLSFDDFETIPEMNDSFFIS